MVRYTSSSQNTSSLVEREQFFKTLQLPEDTPQVHLQTCDRIEVYWGKESVPAPIAHHLFSVVSGLESSMIGECAIQGQVKKYYKDSSESYMKQL